MPYPSIQLVHHGFLDPRFPLYEKFEAIYCESGIQITSAAGLTLDLIPVPNAGNHFEHGDKIRVWLGQSGYFTAAKLNDLEDHAIGREKQKAHAAELLRVARNERRQRAVEINLNLRNRLPFKWRAAVKDVLSGLLLDSNGDGRNRRTVEHIFVLEPFCSGRLKRSQGNYLCTAADIGKNWSNQSASVAVDGDGDEYEPEITCKGCLKLARQLMKRPLAE